MYQGHGPLPRRALAAVAAVAVLAVGGGYLFLASHDAPPEARLRPGAGGSGSPDGAGMLLTSGARWHPAP